MNRFTRNLALALAIVAALGAPTWAQSPSPSPSGAPARHGKPATGDKAPRMMTRLQKELALSDDQVQKLSPILQSYHAQVKQRMQAARQDMESVLTPEQQSQLKQIMQERAQARREHKGQASPSGKRPASILDQLNLTDEQKAQLKSNRQKGMEQRKADQQALFAQTRTILTPDQETKFEQMLSHGGKRGGDHGHGPNKKGTDSKAPSGSDNKQPTEDGPH